MKNLIFASLFTGLLFASCKKKDNEMPKTQETTIDYPAAYVVNGESNTISVIKLSTNEVTATIKLGEMPDPNMAGMNMGTGISWPHHIAINPAKTVLALGVPGMDLSGGHNGGMMGMTGKIALVDAVKGNVIKVIDLPASNHNSIYSPDGSEIWTAQMTTMGKVLVYDANTYTLKKTIDVKKDPAEVTFSSDGMMAYVADGSSDSVTVIDVSSKSVMGHLPVGDDPVGAWTGSDGRMYVDNEAGMSINVIDAMNMTVLDTIDLGFMPGMAAYNGAKSELWVSDPDNGKAHYWTKMGNMYMHGGVFDTGAGAHAIAFSQDGMTAYITNQTAGSVSVVNVSTHTESKEITVGTKPNGIVLKY